MGRERIVDVSVKTTRRLTLDLLEGFRARLVPGSTLTFRTRKTQALLAYLGFDPGRTHRRERLAALLWGNTPDQQARGSLRHALYELRQALREAPAVLSIDGDVVALNAVLVDLDVAVFNRLVRERTPAALAQAAARYHGDLLAGLIVKEEAWENWLRHERQTLRDRAVDGLTMLLAQRESGDDVAAAMETAQRLIALDPLQESVHRALMRLYAQLGRRGAALGQYQQCADALRRELGVEPEAETRRLYRELLQRRADPAAGSAVEAAAPPRLSAPNIRPAETPLVGREADMAELRDAFDRAAVGQGGLVAVAGEAGIGKSRLVEELIGHAQRRDALVLIGRAYESDQILLFGPLVDALRSGHLSLDAELLDALGPTWRAELARLLPEIVAPDAPLLPAQVDYRRLFETLARIIACLAARGPVLVVLEDLHWADELTVRFLAFVGRRISTERALIVVTMREEELEDASTLRHALADLVRARHITRLSVAPLSQRDTAALVRMLVRPDGAATARELEERVWIASEGNPFVVLETMRELQERPGSDGSPLSSRVREAIGRRLERLTDRDRTLLAVAAVIGREFDFELVRHASGLDDEATAEGLEQLVRRRVLTGVGERLGFTHERIREVAYTALPPWRRTRLHLRIAETIETRHADRLSSFWETLAEHCERGEAWARAARYHLSVAGRAKQRYAYATAERSCRQAAAAATKARAPDEVRRAFELLGDVVSLRGDLEHANEDYEAARRVATSDTDRQRIANKVHCARLTGRAGAALAYYEHGGGDETLLLTNPIIYGLEILQPVLEHLCQDFRIITMDLRGTGRSGPIPAGYTTADHAADIGAVIEAAGGEPVTAIGISKSGSMLVRLAVTAPSLVKRLVLIGTPLDTTPGSMSLVPSEVDDRFRAALRAGDLESAMHHFVATVVSDPDTGELAEQFTRNLLRLPRQSILSTWTPDPHGDIAPILGHVKAPTLVLHGGDDRRVSVAAAHHLARHIPDARLHVFEGRGHLPLFTATAEFCEILRRFVRG
jgi:DNA-binding SARP family transcriptional activator/pimeloyl-ACP methyl ester carboxylesterase